MIGVLWNEYEDSKSPALIEHYILRIVLWDNLRLMCVPIRRYMCPLVYKVVVISRSHESQNEYRTRFNRVLIYGTSRRVYGFWGFCFTRTRTRRPRNTITIYKKNQQKKIGEKLKPPIFHEMKRRYAREDNKCHRSVDYSIHCLSIQY